MAFTAEVLGLGRGDALPPPTSQPPPLFPPLEFRPVPLPTGDEWDYMLLLKQEFRGTMRDSPYYIKPQDKKKDIERYSDKYRMANNSDNTIGWMPDWKRLPKELRIRVKKPGDVTARVGMKPNLQAAKTVSKKDVEVVTQRLAELEQKETEAASGDENEEEEGEEEVDEEEYYDEEDQEEGTDYIVSYFDNGEDDMNDEDDGLDDGPVY